MRWATRDKTREALRNGRCDGLGVLRLLIVPQIGGLGHSSVQISDCISQHGHVLNELGNEDAVGLVRLDIVIVEDIQRQLDALETLHHLEPILLIHGFLLRAEEKAVYEKNRLEMVQSFEGVKLALNIFNDYYVKADKSHSVFVAKLIEDVAMLTYAIADLDAAMAKATNLRNDEKAKNTETIASPIAKRFTCFVSRRPAHRV